MLVASYDGDTLRDGGKCPGISESHNGLLVVVVLGTVVVVLS